jgi:hypothetical protein
MSYSSGRGVDATPLVRGKQASKQTSKQEARSKQASKQAKKQEANKQASKKQARSKPGLRAWGLDVRALAPSGLLWF